MGTRAQQGFVRGIIKVDVNISLDAFMDSANVLATRLKSADTDNLITDKALPIIEGWIAAHMYAVRDQPYQSKRTGQASAVFQGQTTMMLSSTYWGQTAIMLDASGNLAAWSKQAELGINPQIGIVWLGSDPAPSQLEES